jgi:hypothetical protein
MVDPQVAPAPNAHYSNMASASSSHETELARSPDVAAEPQGVPDEGNIPGTILRPSRQP